MSCVGLRSVKSQKIGIVGRALGRYGWMAIVNRSKRKKAKDFNERLPISPHPFLKISRLLISHPYGHEASSVNTLARVLVSAVYCYQEFAVFVEG